MIVVLMGVAGSGKTTVGEMLAASIGCPFLEGDALHSTGNIQKMSHGIPLTDTDRAPWLAAIHARMLAWQERWPAIGDVRGLGSMLALEFVADRATKQPAAELARAVVGAALDRGLLLITCGIHGNCIRVLVPLAITDDELEEALRVWGESMAAALD